MTNTNAAKIRIVTVSTTRGDTEVHGPGCADLKRKATKYDNECTWEVGSLVELSHEFWEDQISDQVEPESPEGWAIAEAWVGEFRVLPCAPKFPGEKVRKPSRSERILLVGDREAARCAEAPVPASQPHAFSAKGSAKASACVHCGRTWAAAAHRAHRAAS